MCCSVPDECCSHAHCVFSFSFFCVQVARFKQRVVAGMGPDQLVGACTERITICVARSPEDQLVAVSHSMYDFFFFSNPAVVTLH